MAAVSLHLAGMEIEGYRQLKDTGKFQEGNLQNTKHSTQGKGGEGEKIPNAFQTEAITGTCRLSLALQILSPKTGTDFTVQHRCFVEGGQSSVSLLFLIPFAPRSYPFLNGSCL